MSEMSDMHKLIMAMELAKTARVGMELTYFDVIELLGELGSLKSYIAELEAERRWIPVSERLPEKDGYYLVSDDHGDVLSCEFLTERRVEPIWDDDDGVLYWMPLPEPPEVK